MPRHSSALPAHAQHLGTRIASHQRLGIKPMPTHWLKQLDSKTQATEQGRINKHGSREVEITTQKIGNALGLSSIGKPFWQKVITKDLDEEDKAAHKFFQGKTQVALSNLIMNTPLDIDENKRLFMRVLYYSYKSASSWPHPLQMSYRELCRPYSTWRTPRKGTGHFMCITFSLRS
ncbi:hypothetical protein PIB30_062330 [Stylosanthes scabra]|uniref:Uncharacterized protein n=1 Tax=Stylosanthes scabra TaxID=79078 RepID=A0ABU6TMT0_9FABA|nr:hypothetical protein [Stylosanthes scabra]